jgi:D-serine deaminase-like pyridoxal phosphate-dependent protein
MRIEDLATPALLVDADALEHNLATMAAALPGARLRPHVKAHKYTALAARQARAGHLVRDGEVAETWPVDLRGW